MDSFLLVAFIFLIAGVVAVPIASKLGLGSVLGYLIAGIALSPVLASLDIDVVSVQHFAEFGVVMMLFLVGLELEPKKLWRIRDKLFGLGGLQVGLTAAGVMSVAMIFGLPWTVALATGLVLAVSSTAIVLQTLQEKGLMQSDGGQASFAVLLFEDVAVIPMLAFLPLLALPELVEAQTAAHGAGDHGDGLSMIDDLYGWQQALATVGAIALVIVGGSYLTRPVFRFIAVAKLRELFVAATLLAVIAIALLMSIVGLSPALGTFIAGVVLANSEYRHELESDLGPFKGLLLGLFFITVGAGINFELLKMEPVSILAMTFGLIGLKIAVLYFLGVIFKVRGADRWLLALGLAQAGEFGFVLLSFTVASAVMPPETAEPLLLVVALTMLTTPILFIIYDKLIAPRYSVAQTREPDEIDQEGDIILAGHGRFGVIVNRLLRAAGHKPVVLDHSSAQLDMLRAFGFEAFYGDATRPDLLHAAGIENAKVFIVAIDNKEQATEVVRYVAQTYPNVKIVARAIDRPHVYELWSAGSRDIIRETFDSAVRTGRTVLELMGDSRAEAQRKADLFTRRDREGMKE
ncbi:MAG: cation:proton antiporter, partial [Pseudomonadota bacterium]